MSSKQGTRGLAQYRDLKFGLASAEAEADREPVLLLDGFLDRWQIETRIFSDVFVILGYKGSGKSAVAEHLRLKAESDPLSFVETTHLTSDFDFGAFSELATAVGGTFAGYVTGWQWLLLLHVLSSLARDERAMFDGPSRKAVEALQSVGLLPAKSLRATLLASRRKATTLTLPKVLDVSLEEIKEARRGNVGVLVDELLQAIARTPSDSRHLIAVDGLDEIYLNATPSLDVVAALVVAAERVNSALMRARRPYRILVLCRTDLYERLPGANKNKIRQDSALELDWYEDIKHPSKTALVELANHKARASDETAGDLFDRFFPTHINTSPTVRRNTLGYLLTHTRHTPRDFLQLLVAIQSFAPAQGVLMRDDIVNGVRKYCIEYFLPEMRDELAGVLSVTEIQLLFEFIGSLRRDRYTFKELEQLALDDPRFHDLDLRKLLLASFEASAVGNLDETRSGILRYTYKFRNRHATLSMARPIILHRSLARALGVPEGPSSRRGRRRTD